MIKSCPLLFKSLYVEPINANEAKIAHCCGYTDAPIVPKDEISVHHPLLEKNRKEFLETGELPHHCKACIDHDSAGVDTVYIDIENQQFFDKIKESDQDNNDVELLKMAYNTYSHCNLACIACGPYCSSQWHKEENALLGKQRPYKSTKNFCRNMPIDTSEVYEFYFNGGEPLLNNDMNIFLDRCIEKDNYPSIAFHTNGTKNITKKQIELWSRLPKVTMYMSINDTEDRFEYNRWPAKWDQMQKFLDQAEYIREHTSVNLQLIGVSDISIVNIFTNHNIDRILKERNIYHRIHNTRGFLSLERLHSDIVANSIVPMIDGLNDAYYANKLRAILAHTDRTKDIGWRWVSHLYRMDDMRDLNWKKTFPELWESVKSYTETSFEAVKPYLGIPLGIKSPLIIAKSK